MQEIISLISTHGIGIVCVAYMIYFQNTTMKEMVSALTAINSRLTVIEEKIAHGGGSDHEG